jgi:hypothetical protein
MTFAHIDYHRAARDSGAGIGTDDAGRGISPRPACCLSGGETDEVEPLSSRTGSGFGACCQGYHSGSLPASRTGAPQSGQTPSSGSEMRAPQLKQMS